MNKVIAKNFFSENVVQLVVEAPEIARARRAGHFVIVRVDANSERMPLTISEADTERGTITLVVQRVGVSSAKLCALNAGDTIADLVGPLGRATHIDKFGTVVCACGGVGAAPMLPIAQALKAAGNRVITVLAARNKDLIILRDQLAATSDELIVMTDDGSMGQQGVVTVGVEQVINREKVDRCITIGPAIMMKFVVLTTQKYNIYTEASLNTIMVDGTGMCGACRVTVGGKTRFVCVDGPEFNAHEVDWDQMLTRLRSYKPEEAAAYEQYMQSVRPMTAKERAALPRVKMPELAPEIRAHSLRQEVNQGLSLQQAITEAHRCLNCKKPTCVDACPVNINIPGFIHRLEQGDIMGASDIIRESSSLPAVCGRVCPQEKQCESQCIHLKMGHEAVAIGYLERFVADHSAGAEQTGNGNKLATRVAVVGSGPSGLSCAGDLAKMGYQVTVFEALHEIGGVLKYGIPEFRLPNHIVDMEIAALQKLGVEFRKDTIIGKTLTIDDLKEQGYKAVFVGSGAGLPRFMDIPGENLNGVLSSNEYLTRVNLMDASATSSDTPLLYGKKVAVIGGGNTAMDAVRTAKRLGAERAMIVYRRSEEEMPARVEEVRHAKDEGVEFLTLHNPIEYRANENGRVCQAVLQVMKLGEPDASGRRSPIPVEGETLTLDVDLVIVAVGVSPNPLIPSSVDGLEVTRKGTIAVNEESLQSTLPILFAGGDIVRGGATVILAMSDGRRAAKGIHEFLSNHK
ncbi:MAG: bifunctional dihydroorotate dehydrogenase B NAD binding subunit/NADPH-dependent glutamate synthase [Paludibacteraceae bacterium]|nr:bifunctional dihydroorotate dehydrogenase B NAD binding subunit/NADPH-dependent glutamate synthase [Paludibacteraceae bacterium]